MSLLAVSNRLLELSRRYDLTSDDRTWFLNVAQRNLDSKVFHRVPEARAVGQLAAGNIQLSVENLRALKDVWVHGTGSIQCEILKDVNRFREISGYVDLQTEIQELAGVTSILPLTTSQIYCTEITSKPASVFSDVTVVTRVNLTNTALTVIALTPTAPTELLIHIEDGLLLPLSPALGITAGTVTITGTDIDDAALVEVVDCSSGAGFYTTDGVFKTVTNVDTASFDHLITNDEKITIKTGRRSYLQDLDLSGEFKTSSLLFFPTLDESVMIEVFGDFWTPALVNDTDTTYWTEIKPLVLFWETMKMLESPLRNRSGVEDWSRMIDEALFDINRDGVLAYELGASQTMGG